MNDLNLDWMAVVKWAGSEIEKVGASLLSLELTPDQTAALRGEARALKRLLALPKTRAQEAQRTTASTHWAQ